LLGFEPMHETNTLNISILTILVTLILVFLWIFLLLGIHMLKIVCLAPEKYSKC